MKTTTIKCEKCGNFSIEVIGDEELGCSVCAEIEELELGEELK